MALKNQIAGHAEAMLRDSGRSLDYTGAIPLADAIDEYCNDFKKKLVYFDGERITDAQQELWQRSSLASILAGTQDPTWTQDEYADMKPLLSDDYTQVMLVHKKITDGAYDRAAETAHWLLQDQLSKAALSRAKAHDKAGKERQDFLKVRRAYRAYPDTHEAKKADAGIMEYLSLLKEALPGQLKKNRVLHSGDELEPDYTGIDGQRFIHVPEVEVAIKYLEDACKRKHYILERLPSDRVEAERICKEKCAKMENPGERINLNINSFDYLIKDTLVDAQQNALLAGVLSMLADQQGLQRRSGVDQTTANILPQLGVQTPGQILPAVQALTILRSDLATSYGLPTNASPKDIKKAADGLDALLKQIKRKLGLPEDAPNKIVLSSVDLLNSYLSHMIGRK